MTTHATIYFHEGDSRTEPVSKLYVAADGYPTGRHGVVATLDRFLDDQHFAVQEGKADSVFHSPTRLAARFICWAANDPTHYGESIRPIVNDPPWVDYRYHVVCNPRPVGMGGRPTVEVES